MSEFKIHVGKRYYNRNGHIRGPLVENMYGAFQNTHPLRCPEADETFRVDGTYSEIEGVISDLDLTEEVGVELLQERIDQLSMDVKLLSTKIDTLIEEIHSKVIRHDGIQRVQL